MVSLRLFFVYICGWCCIITSLFQILVTPYQIQISYTDDELKGLQLIASAHYPNGDIILRFSTANSTSTSCYQSNLVLRLVKTDGSISKIPVNFEFPDFNFCGDSFDNGVDGIWIYPIQSILSDFIIITYFTADDTKTFSNAQVQGLLMDTNGKIYQSNYLFGPGYFPIPGQPLLNPGGIIVSSILGQGFIFLIDDNQSNGLIWTQYTAPDVNGTFARLNTQQVIQEIDRKERPKLWSVAMPTLDGGYAVIGGYNVTNATSSTYDPHFRVDVTFFRPFLNGEVDQVGPFLFFQSSVASPLPMICSSSNQGIGYICLARTPVNTTSGNSTSTKIYYQLVNYLSSGSVINIQELPLGDSTGNQANSPAKLYSLFYGGYLETFNTYNGSSVTINGYILDDNGIFKENWGFGNPLTIPAQGVSSSVLLENNTYVIFYFVNNVLNVISTDLYRFYDDRLSRNVKSVSPLPRTSINNSAQSIELTYDRNVTSSSGNITIYQVNPKVPDGTQDIPRFVCTAVKCPLNQSSINGNTLSLSVLPSTFNNPGATYYINIDSGFVKDSQLGEPIPGVQNRTWTFSFQHSEDTFAAAAPALLRLTDAGTAYFNGLSSSGKDEFFNELKRELILAIPIDESRISTSGKYQYDTSTPTKQILISFEFASTRNLTQRNTKSLIDDLNTLVTQRDYSPISFYSLTSYLDKDYGCQAKPNLWDKYKTKLLILFLALLLILVLFMMARIRNNEGNNWAIIQIALIILDFALDVAFILNNGRDVEWIYLPSLLFLLIPIVCNCIIAFSIFVHEHEHNKAFLKWSNLNVKFVPAFTVLAAADIEALNILGSRLAGLNAFSAPFSEKAMAWIFWASTFNMFIEDLPQLIIQVLYQRNTVSYDIIPLLTLITSALMLSINVLGRVYQIIHYLRQGQLRYAIPPTQYEDKDSYFSQDQKAAEGIQSTNIQQEVVNAHIVTVAQSEASSPTPMITSDPGAGAGAHYVVYTEENNNYSDATGHQPTTQNYT